MIDVIIVGAGPAGLSAAIACREHNLDVLILDEFMKPGGRLLGQLHQEPTGEWWDGILETNKLMERVNGLQTTIKCGVPVHHIERTEDCIIVHTNKKQYKTKNVLIATGAAESAIPIPGWTLPGVMSIGAAQVMTNVHRVRVGQKGIIVGVNVLSAAIAHELLLANIDLHSMALPVKNAVTRDEAHPKQVMERLARIAHLAPSAFLRFGSIFAKKSSFVRNMAVNFYPKSGIKMWDMPIHLRKAIKEINGTDKVESVTLVDITSEGDIISGTEQTIDVDFVCIAGGLYPLNELTAVAGCPSCYVEELGGHIPIHNEEMETLVEGIYVAGNVTGIESAKVAREQGTVAGLSIVKSALKNEEQINKKLTEAKQSVIMTRNQATIQFHPDIVKGRQKVTEAFTNCTITN